MRKIVNSLETLTARLVSNHSIVSHFPFLFLSFLLRALYSFRFFGQLPIEKSENESTGSEYRFANIPCHCTFERAKRFIRIAAKGPGTWMCTAGRPMANRVPGMKLNNFLFCPVYLCWSNGNSHFGRLSRFFISLMGVSVGGWIGPARHNLDRNIIIYSAFSTCCMLRRWCVHRALMQHRAPLAAENLFLSFYF